jgi:hypothetical protein
MTISRRWLIAGAVIAAALLAIWMVLAAALLTVWAGLSARSPEPARPQPYLKSVHQAVAPLPPGWPRPATSPSPPARARPPGVSCGQDGAPVAGIAMSPSHCQ